MPIHFRLRRNIALVAAVCGLASSTLHAAEPKQTPENTISVRPAQAVKAQSFSRPLHFYIDSVTDRGGNPQPMLVYKLQGGVFLDREPTKIIKEALEDSLKAAGLLAAEKESADYVLSVYIFYFGMAQSSGLDLFGKAEVNVVVKDRKSGQSQQVSALGTSVQGNAIRKKNVRKNVKESLDDALEDVLRNFLRGTKLRDAIAALSAAS